MDLGPVDGSVAYLALIFIHGISWQYLSTVVVLDYE
jgi:hypothetical protein